MYRRDGAQTNLPGATPASSRWTRADISGVVTSPASSGTVRNLASPLAIAPQMEMRLPSGCQAACSELN